MRVKILVVAEMRSDCMWKSRLNWHVHIDACVNAGVKSIEWH